jgi:hypothetical protein
MAKSFQENSQGSREIGEKDGVVGRSGRNQTHHARRHYIYRHNGIGGIGFNVLQIFHRRN